jgi:hypothetical protein
MGRRLFQSSLPLVDEAGTHRRECECPRCEAGYRPSEKDRAAAARRFEEQQERLAAAAALARQRARQRVKAMRTALRLEEEERRTAARLAEEAALRARVKADDRLDALLESRRLGHSIAEAVEAADGPATKTDFR